MIWRAAAIPPMKKANEVTGEYTKEIAIIVYLKGEVLPKVRVSTYEMPADCTDRRVAARTTVRKAFQWAAKQWLRMDVEAVYAHEVTKHGSAFTIGVWE